MSAVVFGLGSLSCTAANELGLYSPKKVHAILGRFKVVSKFTVATTFCTTTCELDGAPPPRASGIFSAAAPAFAKSPP
jgi:hypothetical protein